MNNNVSFGTRLLPNNIFTKILPNFTDEQALKATNNLKQVNGLLRKVGINDELRLETAHFDGSQFDTFLSVTRRNRKIGEQPLSLPKGVLLSSRRFYSSVADAYRRVLEATTLPVDRISRQAIIERLDNLFAKHFGDSVE